MTLVRSLLDRLLLAGALLYIGLHIIDGRTCGVGSALPDLEATLRSVLQGLN